MNVAVFGCGYVGLTCAVGLAELGHNVVGIDIDSEKIKSLHEGTVPIYESGLQDMFKKHVELGNLLFSEDGVRWLEYCDIALCAVSAGEKTDFDAVKSVAEVFADAAKDETIFVIKSTVPVGSAEKIQEIVAPKMVVANPEFLREGTALEDFLHPQRVVVGLDGDDESVVSTMKKLYCYGDDVPFVFTNLRNAELIKYASNVFLATKISFANELANLCEATGADVQEVVRGMGFDLRIGSDFLQAGIGFGGSCLPKSVQTLLDDGAILECDLPLLEAVKRVNENRIERLLLRLEREIGSLAEKKIAVWGVTFKPNTNDVREAPALKVVEKLRQAQAQISAFDPVAPLEEMEDMYAALEGADALLILTEWDAFKNPDYMRMKSLMKEPLVVDGRNVLDPQKMRAEGFRYLSVGRA